MLSLYFNRSCQQSFSAALLLISSLVPLATCALNALSITPSTTWYGDDGDWSAISLRIGEPPQWVDVFPNTRSSETWVVDTGGCGSSSLCTSSRGGVFNSTASTTWEPLGFYSLGVNSELGNTGYAGYGLDSVTLGSTGVTIKSSIVGTVNNTNFTWLGGFGLGTVPGNFNGKSPLSAISALVEQQGIIPSHSYGFTAGASYRGKGVPNSLTLGGYDSNRFVAHNTKFQLNPNQQPQVYINSISAVSTTSSSNWTVPVSLLSAADRVSAVVDSSTPYLWFPAGVCDSFAASLGLSYNSSLNLYTFDGNPSQRQVLQTVGLTFTFVLSDLSSSSQLINITLPYDAFDLQLTYPAIPNTTYGSEAASKYYFPLRRATTEAQYRIGKAFLQEAYIVTDYERSTFALYQAVHTSNPISNLSIVAIPRSGSSTFSGPPTSSKKLSAGAIAGIVIGAVIGIAIVAFAIFCFCRRRRQNSETIDEKNTPPGPLRTFFGLRRRKENGEIHEATGSTNYATEVGADATHERFELPAPLGPVELDSEAGSLEGRTEYSSNDSTQGLSAYEVARRKMERQQAAARVGAIEAEKTENDASQVAHYRPSDFPDSGLVSPFGGSSIGTGSLGQPSPLTPGFDRDFASPPSYQRINPSQVIYAGRLPGHIQLPSNIPKVVGRDGRTIRTEGSSPPISEPTNGTSTLGSHYTDNEGSDPVSDLYSAGSSDIPAGVSPVSNQSGSGSIGNALQSPTTESPDDIADSLNPMGSRRRLDGEDLIHIPQPAERRFSFEEETISGTRDGGTS